SPLGDRLHVPRPGFCVPECPTRQAPDTRRSLPGHAPCPSALPAHSTVSSPTTTSLPTDAPSALVLGQNAVSVAPGRLLFFGVLAEGIRRRDLSQHTRDDLIRQTRGLLGLPSPGSRFLLFSFISFAAKSVQRPQALTQPLLLDSLTVMLTGNHG